MFEPIIEQKPLEIYSMEVVSAEESYERFFVTFTPEQIKQNPKRDGTYALIQATTEREAMRVALLKCGEYHGFFNETDFKKLFPNVRQSFPQGGMETYASVYHNGRIIIFNSDPPENRQVAYVETVSPSFQKTKGFSVNDVLWIYELSGAHDGGEPFRIAVLNPHYDFDTAGKFVTDEGYYWADDLSDAPDFVPDWYDGVLHNAIADDYNESGSDYSVL